MGDRRGNREGAIPQARKCSHTGAQDAPHAKVDIHDILISGVSRKSPHNVAARIRICATGKHPQSTAAVGAEILTRHSTKMITETFDEYVKKMFVTREIDARVGTSLTALQTRCVRAARRLRNSRPFSALAARRHAETRPPLMPPHPARRFDTRFPFKPTSAIPVVSKSGLVHAPDNWTSAFRMRELWELQTEKRKAAGKVIY